MDKKNKMFNRGLLLGLFLFSLMIAWMSYDIFSRDGIIGGSTNVLVMGTNAGFKPFEYKEGENVVGFDVDLAKEIAKELGKELKIEDMAFDGLLPALDSGQIDMAIAQENIWLEADALGLGGVWLGIAPLNERMDAVGKILDLPTDKSCELTVSYGISG